MRVIYGFDAPVTLRHAVATIGSYDGVHCGHRILLEEVMSRARSAGGESVVLTFEPHPRITLHNDDGLRLLSTLDEKVSLLESVGMECVVVIPFDEAFSRLSHEQFLNDYIIGKLGIEQLVVGYNHRFGRDKGGDFAYLDSNGGLSVVEISRQSVDGDKVSSTVIRSAIERGDMKAATRLLGHPYMIKGKTDARGVMSVDKYKLLPPAGEYRAEIDGKECVVSIAESDLICLAEYKQQEDITIAIL